MTIQNLDWPDLIQNSLSDLWCSLGLANQTEIVQSETIYCKIQDLIKRTASS